MDCAAEIVRKEGVKSLFKGASANILRTVVGGGALAVYDQLHLIFWGKKDGAGE
jgi:solute carrier family 25 (adenine nucleotide translocator) protein 4/5/6/31